MPVATELRLHRSLYDDDAVYDVAAKYAGVATIQIEADGDSLRVHIDQIDPDVADVLVDHFCNHVLSETVVRFNQAESSLQQGRT